ncbi:MAG: hypothetical protein ACL7BU_00320 [Candidatus Phlomobacter fragariae]
MRGWKTTDILEYIKYLLMSRGGDLGMMIMILCGFFAYMTHIGANDVVVKIGSKAITNDQFTLCANGCLLNVTGCVFISGTVLLMATLFPIIVNVSIRRGKFVPHLSQ